MIIEKIYCYVDARQHIPMHVRCAAQPLKRSSDHISSPWQHLPTLFHIPNNRQEDLLSILRLPASVLQ